MVERTWLRSSMTPPVQRRTGPPPTPETMDAFVRIAGRFGRIRRTYSAGLHKPARLRDVEEVEDLQLKVIELG